MTLPVGWRRWSALAALILLAAAAYGPVLGNGFIGWDDEAYIYGNPRVRTGLAPGNIAWAFTSFYVSNWHPLTWLSHMLDVQLFGTAPGLHHGVSLLFHLAGTLLLVVVLSAMTGAFGRALAVAALFALHPLHVESVAWAAERKDVLSAAFGLGAVWAYLSWVRRPGRGRYVLVAAAQAAALMSKPMMVTLPAAFLLLDFWPLGRMGTGTAVGGAWGSPPLRRASGLVLEKWPLWLMSAASAVVTFQAQLRGGAVATLEHLGIAARLANAVTAPAAYLVRTFYPARLAVIYPLGGSPGARHLLAAALLLAAVSVAAVLLARRRPYVLMGWLWFLSGLAPVLGIVQVGNQAMADRYTYWPLTGIFLIAVWAAADLSPGRAPAVPPAAAVAVVAVLALLTRTQAGYWRSGATVFAHAAAAVPGNWVAHGHLGVALASEGKTGEAIAQFRQALKYKPDDAETLNNLGVALAGAGRPREAIEFYLRALSRKPDYANAHYNLGVSLMREGRIEEAAAAYREALRLDPGDASAHINLGNILFERGDADGAADHYRGALRIDPYNAQAHNNLGIILAGRGMAGEAAGHFREALRAKPDYDQARDNLRRALEGTAGR